MQKLDDLRERINSTDRKAAELFEERMQAVKEIAAIKKAEQLPVRDDIREAEIFRQADSFIKDEKIKPYYQQLLKKNIELSRQYQNELLTADLPCISIKSLSGFYNVYIKSGGLSELDSFFDLKRRVLIVSDDGVPLKYIQQAAAQCGKPCVEIFRQGEKSKNTENWQKLLNRMLKEKFSRDDCVLAVGGGVVGDMAGFAASAYMRGIDFYNIPTTLLAQADASIGGKVAVDFGGCKNMIGAFYPPKAVLIDTELLSTLTERHFRNGMAEIVKAAAVSDGAFFAELENTDFHQHIEETICRAVLIKKKITELDAEEKGLRKVLNFGHTFAHALESAENFSGIYHGEAVALGMLKMSSDEAFERIKALLDKIGLPTEYKYDKEKIIKAMLSDKKRDRDKITLIKVRKIGSYEMQKLSLKDLQEKMEVLL